MYEWISSISVCVRSGPIQWWYQGDDWPAARKVLETVLEVCQPMLPSGECRQRHSENPNMKTQSHKQVNHGVLATRIFTKAERLIYIALLCFQFFLSSIHCLTVHGGGELCHVQPSSLRLLHVSSLGKHGGLVSGHVLHDNGALVRHLQAVQAAWEVLWCKS